jgi:hypothetical protein
MSLLLATLVLPKWLLIAIVPAVLVGLVMSIFYLVNPK